MLRPKAITSYRYFARTYFFCLLSTIPTTQAAESATQDTDQHIRAVVSALLKEKDQKIQQLEARIQQLEQSSNQPKPPVVTSKPSEKSITAITPVAEAKLNSEPHAGNSTEHDHHEVHKTVFSKLGDLGEQIEELKLAAAAKSLNIRGFFDVDAKTDNSTDQNFSVGYVELDLEYSYNAHFATSAALVLCGNSSGTEFSAPASVTCGGSSLIGISHGAAGIAVALLDYHQFDSTIPPRGRIFNGQGFHIQAGRFDIPISSDYQNFANTDRITISAPITTARMQYGGFNGDGIRSYGSWKQFNYSAFLTNAMYASDGISAGGRLGMTLGQNTYRIHNNDPEGLEIGISHLSDLDKNHNLRHAVYGTDLSLGYGFLRLQSELLWAKAYDNFVAPNNAHLVYGKPNEFGYHATLIANLENFIDKPISAFARYGRWQPNNRFGSDYNGNVVAINNVSALTVGLNYRVSEHLKIKFEYTDSLGTSTQERYFDKKLGSAQMVVAF
jgi:hypothetical protein